MLEKYNSNDIFHVPTRYHIDQFNNPYLARMAIKILPNPKIYTSKFNICSPFDNNNSIHLSQALPIFRTNRFRIALLWHQDVKKNYVRGHFGATLQYKVFEAWKFKAKGLFGSTATVSGQIVRNFPLGIQLMVGGSSFTAHNNIYNSLGIWMKKGEFKFGILGRLQHDKNLVASYNRKIRKDLILEINLDKSIDNTYMTAQCGLKYKFRPQWVSYALVSAESHQKKIGMKFEIQKQTKRFGNVSFNVEYREEKSIVYLGYKSPSFQFVIPLAIMESAIPVLISGIAFVVGYYFRKGRESENNQKQVSYREQQLRLIQNKANQNHLKEKQINGLCIEEAYVGPKQKIEEFLKAQNKAIQILRNPYFKDCIFDITLSLRFMVSKGKLDIPKGQKTQLLGYFSESDYNNYIYISYENKGIKNDIFIHQSQSIKIA